MGSGCKPTAQALPLVRGLRPYLPHDLQGFDTKLKDKLQITKCRTNSSLDTVFLPKLRMPLNLPTGLLQVALLQAGKTQRKTTGSLQQHTYICLYHLAALSPDPAHEAINVHLPLGVHHVQHGVNDDKSARASHPSAAMAEGQTIRAQLHSKLILVTEPRNSLCWKGS